MPNTLAHLGAQGLVTRALIGQADLRWIALGAVVPDVPWILQRVVRTVIPGVDPYELRVYAIAQASLLVSLMLCGALALLAVAPRRAFAVLSLNAMLHLLLDAAQTKWANGVHLLAPLHWEPWNLGWFWPESLPTYALTLAGPVVVAWGWWRGWSRGPAITFTVRRAGAAGLLLTSYLLVPVAMREGVARADNHYVSTLRAQDRTGRDLELDRNRHKPGTTIDSVITLAGERLLVREGVLERDAIVSVRATFVDHETLRIRELHDHTGWPRDALSYAGLLVVVLLWLRPRAR